MSPISVALIHCDKPSGWKRMVGWWSYPVSQFKVTHFGVKKGFSMPSSRLDGHDIVFHEDHKTNGTFPGLKIPRVYHIIDSTLGEGIYRGRCEQAKGAALILVDHDRIERFTHIGPPVRRFGYCVNDRMFYDRIIGKEIDVSYHCRGWFQERGICGRALKAFCEKRKYEFASGKRYNKDYSRAFCRSKISVNLPVNNRNRSHRTFDVMASRTCLLTKKLVSVSGEIRTPDVHYAEWNTYEEMYQQIDHLLKTGKWKKIADAAYELVKEHHTWAVRAQQLYDMLKRTVL